MPRPTLRDALTQRLTLLTEALDAGTLTRDALRTWITGTTEVVASFKTAPRTHKEPPGAKNGGSGDVGAWLTPYCDAWQARYGSKPAIVKQMAQVLRPLEKLHGPAIVLKHWTNYLASTAVEYVSLQKTFASAFVQWDKPRRNGFTRNDPQTAGKSYQPFTRSRPGQPMTVDELQEAAEQMADQAAKAREKGTNLMLIEQLEEGARIYAENAKRRAAGQPTLPIPGVGRLTGALVRGS